jgi:hypothetical protein
MAGSDDLDWIAHYNARGRLFSDDGRRLPAAFGYRLRGAHEDQLHAIVNELSINPGSRRAIASITEAADLGRVTRDQPCAVALQYFIRAGAVEAVTYMRSQSGFMVLPYDGFLFMATQCWVAAMLRVPVGRYHHMMGSLHVYEDEIGLAEAFAGALPVAGRLGHMPEPEAELARLTDWEQELRSAVRSERTDRIEALASGDSEADTFWARARTTLAIDAADRVGLEHLSKVLVDRLPTGWRSAMFRPTDSPDRIHA